MKFIPSFGEITAKGKQTFKRFPITIAWAIISTLFVLYVIEVESPKQITYVKMILVFVLGISWLIATRFFEEQFQQDKEWIFLITLGFLFGFYLSIPNDETVDETMLIRFTLYLIAGHLLVFVAPFVFKHDTNTYFNYVKAIFIAIVRSLFFSMVLYLGIVLALLAIKHLFTIDFDGKRFFQLFIICVGIVNTWIYLSDFPLDVHAQKTIHYTKALEVLVKYILIPLVVLYLIILYAYSLKIVVNWRLPKGWVSYLVTALAFLGFLIQVLIRPIEKTIDSRIMKRFYPWFYYLLLPLTLLLFVAIFRRISEYGITEKRYFVLVLACWILGITLYMLIKQHKKTTWFSLSLAFLALLISFGAWGAFSVSTKSQVHQFKKVFNEIKAQKFTTTYEKKSQLHSIVQYLADKNATHKIANELGYNPEETFKDENSWALSNSIMDSLHVTTTTTKGADAERYKHYGLSRSLSFPIDGYMYMKNIELNEYETNLTAKTIRGYHFVLSSKTNNLRIANEKKRFFEIINLDSLVVSLLRKPEGYDLKNSDELTVVKQYDTLKLKLIFTNLNITTEKEKSKINYANAFVFIKENE